MLQRVRATSADSRIEESIRTELSDREIEVLKLIANGKDNAHIAAELHISPKTVKNHISNILMKLQIHNRIQAAVYAVRSRDRLSHTRVLSGMRRLVRLVALARALLALTLVPAAPAAHARSAAARGALHSPKVNSTETGADVYDLQTGSRLRPPADAPLLPPRTRSSRSRSRP